MININYNTTSELTTTTEKDEKLDKTTKNMQEGTTSYLYNIHRHGQNTTYTY